jgi:hypothetical protein
MARIIIPGRPGIESDKQKKEEKERSSSWHADE